jgi:hypothetical protein
MRWRENGENCITRNNQVEDDGMGGSCSTNGGEEECV